MKKKFLIFGLLGLAFAMFLIYACNDSLEVSQNGNELVMRSETVLIPNHYIDEPEFVFNQNNPMDFMGEFHNEFLYYLVEKTKLVPQQHPDSLINHLNSYLIKMDSDIELMSVFKQQFTSEFIKLNSHSTNLHDLEFIYDLKSRGIISGIESDYFISLYNEVDKIDEYLIGNNGDMLQAYLLVNQELKRIEQEVISDEGFPNEMSKNNVLSVASIYRFSLYNFFDIVNNPENLFVKTIKELGFDDVFDYDKDDIQAIRVLGADWDAVGKADGKGAIVGTAVTAITAGVAAIFTAGISLGAAAAGVAGFSSYESLSELYDQIMDGPAWICWWCWW